MLIKIEKNVDENGSSRRLLPRSGFVQQIPNHNVQNYKGNGVVDVDQSLDQLIINPKGGHGLPNDSFRLQTMTAFNEKLLQGVQGDGFLEKSPPGRRRH